ncbi:MAG TPA: hypothetical protein VG206_08030 [Terriglobia bacterium]|nr:hypothetical protein [Terriglobia bacterium]
MAVRSSKKQLILESCANLKRPSLGLSELRRVQQDLRQRLVPAEPPSLGYIASVLRAAGLQVDYEDRYAAPLIPDRYAGRLEGVLRFDSLAAAEATLRSLDAAYRCWSGSDRGGASLVRKLVLHGKQRAEALAGNARIRPEKRHEKREIATWFRVWLESPDLFFDWLEIRKQTEEFRQLFPLAPVPGAAATNAIIEALQVACPSRDLEAARE